MPDFISVNGQLIPYDDARIAPGDTGFLHGAGLFETLRVHNSKPFRLAQHLARLTASAATLSISFSLDLPQLQELISDLLEANDLKDARLRITISRGDLHEATADNPEPPTTLVIAAAAFTPYAATLYEKGMTVQISRFKQNPDSPVTGHKTTSYFDRLLALRDAQQAQCSEALVFTGDNATVAEGCISNVFAVLADGTLATPPLNLPNTDKRLCLPGITRELIFSIAKDLGVLPHDRLIPIADLLAAREIFLTNAIMGVMPVTHLEQHTVGSGVPGEVTGKLRTAYAQLLAVECL